MRRARRGRRLLDAGHQGARRGADDGRRRGDRPRAARRRRRRRRARDASRTRGGTALARRAAATGRAGEVAAIAVAGQQHGLVVLDGADRAAAPRHAVERHAQRRGRRRARRRARRGALGGGHRRRPRGVVHGLQVGVAAARGARDGGRGARARPPAARPPHRRLTGEAATDRGDASGHGLVVERAEGYSDEVLGLPAVDLDPALLPPVSAPRARGGRGVGRRGRGARAAGRHPVAAGTGDNMAAALGLGVEPGTPVLSPRHVGHGLRRLRAPPGRRRPASSRASPTPAGATCRSPARSTPRWRSTGWRRGSGSTATPWSPAARSWCCRGSTASARRTCPTPPARSTGLRHATTRGQILRATYDGAIAGLLDAIAAIDACSSGVAADAPLLLVGGGAQGAAWRDAVLRLSGRAVQVPDGDGARRARRRGPGREPADGRRSRRRRARLGHRGGRAARPAAARRRGAGPLRGGARRGDRRRRLALRLADDERAGAQQGAVAGQRAGAEAGEHVPGVAALGELAPQDVARRVRPRRDDLLGRRALQICTL